MWRGISQQQNETLKDIQRNIEERSAFAEKYQAEWSSKESDFGTATKDWGEQT